MNNFILGSSINDLYRINGTKSFSVFVKMIILNPGYRFLFHFRRINEKKIFYHLDKIFIFFLKRKYGIEISQLVNIGKALLILHPYNITINGNAKIGDNVTICKGVTIGSESRGIRMGTPVIGDKVYIGVNSTIVGGISIGSNVLIAPNTFVNVTIPDNSVVLGNPCIIKSNIKATESYVYNILTNRQLLKK